MCMFCEYRSANAISSKMILFFSPLDGRLCALAQRRGVHLPIASLPCLLLRVFSSCLPAAQLGGPMGAIYLSIYLSIYLNIRLSMYTYPISIPSLFFWLYLCPPLSLSLSLSMYLFILSLSFSLFPTGFVENPSLLIWTTVPVL